MNRLTLDDRYSAMPWDALDAVVFDVGNVLGRRPSGRTSCAGCSARRTGRCWIAVC